MAVLDTLRGLIEPWLADEDLELDDLELKGSGSARTLRVVVDRPEGGVDLDLLSDVSAGVSRLLDDEDELDGPYRLEVTSPGLERSLRTPRHFQKSVGREVTIKLRRDGETSVLKGVLDEAGDETFSVETTDGQATTGAYADVVSARTVFRWEKAPKPGKK